MIRLIYDNIEHNNASDCVGISNHDNLLYFLRDFNIPYTREDIKTANLQSKCYYSVIPIHFDSAFGHNCNSFINDIPINTLTHLQDNTNNLKLLIFFPMEGYDLSHFNFITIKFLNSLHDVYGIPLDKIMVCYGDLNIKKNLFNRQVNCILPVENILGINIFESIAYKDTLNVNFKLPNVDSYSKHKRFLFKNGVARSHRIYLAGAFKYLGLLDQMYFSWLNTTKLDYQSHSNTLLPGTFSLFNNGVEKVEYTNSFRELILEEPYILDISQEEASDRHNQIKISENLYESSYCSIVSETVCDEYNTGGLFISEKTYQPIYNFHPFIIIGAQGNLNYLKESGFATFPEFFDESYDGIKNTSERINKVIEEVHKFCLRDTKEINDIYFSEAFQDKLIYNWKHFLSSAGKAEAQKFYNWAI